MFICFVSILFLYNIFCVFRCVSHAKLWLTRSHRRWLAVLCLLIVFFFFWQIQPNDRLQSTCRIAKSNITKNSRSNSVLSSSTFAHRLLRTLHSCRLRKRYCVCRVCVNLVFMPLLLAKQC